MLQRTKYKILTYSLLAVLLALLFGFWFWYSHALGRDYERLGDLRAWQSIMADYYDQHGTYVIPACEPGREIANCLAVSSGNAAKNNIRDPQNTGSYRYLVQELSDTDYAILFSLEVGLGDLPAGQYVWTKNGVRK